MQPAAVHAVTHDFVVAGETYRVAVAGPANGFALLAVGSALFPRLPTSLGTLAIDPSSLQIIGAAAIPATVGYYVGNPAWNLPCPTNVPYGHVFAFQAAVLDPTGAITLTAPSPFTVGWQHGRIP